MRGQAVEGKAANYRCYSVCGWGQQGWCDYTNRENGASESYEAVAAKCLKAVITLELEQQKLEQSQAPAPAPEMAMTM